MNFQRFNLWERIRKEHKIIPNSKAYNLLVLYMQDKLLNISNKGISDFTYFSVYTRDKEVYNSYPLKLSYISILKLTFPIYNNKDIFSYLIKHNRDRIEFIKITNIYKCNDFKQYKIGYVLPRQLKGIML